MLGGRINSAGGKREFAYDRAEIDNGPPSLAAHPRQTGLSHPDERKEIDFEEAPDGREGNIFHGTSKTIARIVDKDRNRLGKLRDLLAETFKGLRIGKVDRPGMDILILVCKFS